MVHARVSFITQQSNNLILFDQSEEHEALFFGISWDVMGDVITLRMQPLYTSQNLKKGLTSRARAKSRNEKTGLERSIMAVTFVVTSHYCTEIRVYSIILYS